MALKEIKDYYEEMSQAEKKAAKFVLEYPEKVVSLNLAEVAKRSGTSDATVIRMCRHIGYSGFYQLKIGLAIQCSEGKRLKNTRPKDVESFFSRVAAGISDVSKNIDMKVLKRCVDLLAKAQTVYTVAWGNTGEIAADFAHRLTRIGIKSFAADVPEYAMRGLGLAGENDVLVAFSHSGEALHVIQALQLTKELNIPSVLITDAKKSPATELADCVLATKAREHLFDDLGGASHVLELIVVDALLYFLKDKETTVEKGNRAEFLLSHYKL